MYILSFDIGGANLKYILTKIENYELKIIKIIREYFPLWIKGKKGLEEKLKEIYIENENYVNENCIVSICMTAELCDIYKNKIEGVKHVINSTINTFSKAKKILILSNDFKLVNSNEVENYNLIKFAASNWIASAWIIEKMCNNCIFIDIGSTTTTIIPIVNGKVFCKGFTDPEKLTYGELVYTGILRTNVSTIVNEVPYKGYFTRVCSEKFALTGDIHLILNNIKPNDYTTETANGKGISREEVIDRIARIPCADSNILNEFEVIEIAKYVYENQIFQIMKALFQIRSRIASLNINPNNFKILVTGIGEFLAIEVVKRLGYREIVKISDIYGKEISSIFPAYALTLMTIKQEFSNNISEKILSKCIKKV